MQFKILALASFLAVAIAAPTAQPDGELVVRKPLPAVPFEVPAMANADGDVVPFSSSGVVQPMKNSGQ